MIGLIKKIIQKKQIMKNESKITLIALVIILIIAGISVTFVLGDNGILNKASIAEKLF